MGSKRESVRGILSALEGERVLLRAGEEASGGSPSLDGSGGLTLPDMALTGEQCRRVGFIAASVSRRISVSRVAAADSGIQNVAESWPSAVFESSPAGILHSAFCLLHSLPGGFVGALWALYGRIEVALVEPWGGLEGALGWLWGAYRLAINTL